MSQLDNWLRSVVEGGELRRRRPFGTWYTRFGDTTTRKRLWAYSASHRWVWNYCRDYRAYQEFPTNMEQVRERLGRTSWWARHGESIDVRALTASNRDFNQRTRHYLMGGMRPDLAYGRAIRQLTEEARLIMMQGALGAGGFSTGMNYAPIAEHALGRNITLRDHLDHRGYPR